MVFPLHDDNPASTKPYVTVGIMVVCTLAYVWQHLLQPAGEAHVVALALGAIPGVLTGQPGSSEFLLVTGVPAVVTVFTSLFLHAGFWHLAGNMLFLWIFGNNVEDAMGHVRFFLFYLLCGAAAVMTQALANPTSIVPIVGASGAISGVLGAYLLLYPRARVLLGLPLGFVLIELGRFPAAWVLLAWFVLQLALGGLALAQDSSAAGGIAFGAHVGGFIAGCVLVVLFKRRDVPLWRRY